MSEQIVTLDLDLDLAGALQLQVHDERDQHVSRCLRQEGVWEPYETRLLLTTLQPGDVFVDVGANIGYFTVLAAAVVGPAGAVFAFEPDPANFALLQANIARNALDDRVEAVQAGLAAADGAGRLYLSEDNLGDHQIYAAEPGRSSVPIALYDGGRFLGERLARLDLLKVDTQGSEYQVMLGLLPLVRRLPVLPRILIELTPFSLRQAGASGRALIELLATLELPLWIVDHVEHRLVASDAPELARWCDDVDACNGDRGFMNILVGLAP